MLKATLILAKTLDSFFTFWIFTTGFFCLWEKSYFEASALIIAGVFWQRAWKANAIKAANDYLNKDTQS